MLMAKIFACAIAFLSSTDAFARSGTGIGNGGDPLFSFLSSTRYIYTEVVKDFGLDGAVRDGFCQEPSHLTADQKIFCRNFLAETYQQLLELNGSSRKVEFFLRQEPLLVEGPDGKPMPVAARTVLGPEGGIEFHRPSILYYPPRQMLFLLAHEFGHKVVFRGRPVSDNESVGPFATGRELLDTVAAAIVAVAEAKGRIGKSFGLRDFWQCQIIFSSGTITGFSAASLRLFFRNNLDQYEGGISRRPDDPQLFAYENLNSRLVFRIRVQENLGCLGQASQAEDRNTRLEIVRVREQAFGKANVEEELVTALNLPFVNPFCEEKPRSLELSTGQVSFRCQYSGSQ